MCTVVHFHICGTHTHTHTYTHVHTHKWYYKIKHPRAPWNLEGRWAHTGGAGSMSDRIKQVPFITYSSRTPTRLTTSSWHCLSHSSARKTATAVMSLLLSELLHSILGFGLVGLSVPLFLTLCHLVFWYTASLWIKAGLKLDIVSQSLMSWGYGCIYHSIKGLLTHGLKGTRRKKEKIAYKVVSLTEEL